MQTNSLRTAASLLGGAACALLAATLLCASAARAEGQPGSGSGSGHPRHPRHPPPPEALAACEGKASGAACSFQHDGHDVAGACWAPEGKPLACKPDRPPPHEGESGERR